MCEPKDFKETMRLALEADTKRYGLLTKEEHEATMLPQWHDSDDIDDPFAHGKGTDG
tara:strand:+ start:26 stop:196 length:171 start_codon:yes stop_codon:yes gene_type:complete